MHSQWLPFCMLAMTAYLGQAGPKLCAPIAAVVLAHSARWVAQAADSVGLLPGAVPQGPQAARHCQAPPELVWADASHPEAACVRLGPAPSTALLQSLLPPSSRLHSCKVSRCLGSAVEAREGREPLNRGQGGDRHRRRGLSHALAWAADCAMWVGEEVPPRTAAQAAVRQTAAAFRGWGPVGTEGALRPR